MRLREIPGRGGGREGRPTELAVLAVFIACLLNACANGRNSPPEPLRDELVIAVERADDVPPGSLFLKPVPGGLLGKTENAALFRSSPGAERVRVPVRELSARLDEHALLARSDAFNPGELAHPRELRIARVGTFYESASRDGGCSNFRTALRGAYPAQAMLVYVDRPATLRGARYAAPYIVQYELEFPAAGIYAVGVQTRGMVVTQRVLAVDAPLVAKVRRAPCG